MTDAKGHGKSVEELFPCPFFTGAETGQCKSNGSLYAARHLWEEAAKRLKGQIEGQTEKRSPKPYGFRLLSGSGRRIRTLTYGVRVRCATITQSRYIALFAALCRSANIRYYSRNFAFVNRKFSKKSKFGKFLPLPHFPVTSRWQTSAAAARTRGAVRCAWPTPLL